MFESGDEHRCRIDEYAPLGFDIHAVWGRNWSGYIGGRARRLVTRVIDRALRAVPTLCSDLYVMAVKPLQPHALASH